MNAEPLSEQLGVAIENLVAPLAASAALAVEVRQGGQVIYNGTFGRDTVGAPVRTDTLFDLGALTELFTLTAFLRLVDTGRLWIDTPVSIVLEGFDEKTTFYQLLTHSAGLPETFDLSRYRDYDARVSALLRLKPHPAADHATRYSPLDFILIGFALEILLDLPLAQAVAMMVLQPLDLRAQFIPLGEAIPMVGRPDRDVADRSARDLDSVAGHAGLFGTASDLGTLATLFLEGGVLGSAELLSETISGEATRQHHGTMGLGWNQTFANPSDGFGYTAATGSFVRVDGLRDLVITLLVGSSTETSAIPDALRGLPDMLLATVQRLTDSATE